MKMWQDGLLSIRRRKRLNSSPPEGMRQEWTEFQVVYGREILHRAGSYEEALNYITERSKAEASK